MAFLFLTTPNILVGYNRFLFLFGSLPIHYEVTERKRYGRLVARDGPVVGHIRVFSPKVLKSPGKITDFVGLKVQGLRFLYGKSALYIFSLHISHHYHLLLP